MNIKASETLFREGILERQRVLITGGTGELGSHIIDALSYLGAQVYFFYNSNRAKAEKIAERLESKGLLLGYFQADFSKVEEESGQYQEITRKIRPTAFISNAATTQSSLLVFTGHEEVDQMLKINTLAPILLSKYCLEEMYRERYGRFIFISSIAAERGVLGSSVYCCAKSAINGFMRGLSMENRGMNISANALSPSTFLSRLSMDSMTEEGLNSALKSKEHSDSLIYELVNSCIKLLASESCSINGQNLVIDSGVTNSFCIKQ
ncbi:MAG: hypothetical protein CENE_00165 [Candidatus Celerinatantimonas neptuna]|nr:MAG: hypothetical protein CENE_00165 [Candidatus Celerinatantimonas neptuna]